MRDYFVRSPSSVKSLAGRIWAARRYLNILLCRDRRVAKDVTAKVKQDQEQVRFQNGLLCTVLLQKCVATGTKEAFLFTYRM
jgi:hypothetical protein